MKGVIAGLVLCVPLMSNAVPLPAQIEVSRPAACGEPTEDVSVDLDKSAHAPVAAQPDKALVYVVQQIGELELGFGFPMTRVGMDGKWIGANKKNSYFSFYVAPGDQHLCVGIQSDSYLDDVELFHFKAEAGKVYYFRTRVSWGGDTYVYLSVDPMDSDEGGVFDREISIDEGACSKGEGSGTLWFTGQLAVRSDHGVWATKTRMLPSGS